MSSSATAPRLPSFILEETLAAAEADGEMAYRLATYFAVDGDESEALHWLRRAIYLGNENYPWFSKNPAWRNLQGHTDFERILEDLKKSLPPQPEKLEAAACPGPGLTCFQLQQRRAARYSERLSILRFKLQISAHIIRRPHLQFSLATAALAGVTLIGSVRLNTTPKSLCSSAWRSCFSQPRC